MSVRISLKALLTIQVNIFLFNGQSTKLIAYSFHVRKDFSHAGRELHQVEAFPRGPYEGIFQLPHRLTLVATSLTTLNLTR